MKPTNRVRIAAPIPVLTRADAETEVGAIANLTLERNAAQILRDDEIVRIREKFGDTLAAFEALILLKTERLREWAEANPDEFPKGKKSLEFTHGTIGFRTGTPKLKTLGRKTWAAVLVTIKRFGITPWVRVEESVNKEQIIADSRSGVGYAPDEIATTMRQVGVQVVQDETFFIEPNLEDLETRRTA